MNLGGTRLGKTGNSNQQEKRVYFSASTCGMSVSLWKLMLYPKT